MARIWSSGAELNSNAAGMEYDTFSTATISLVTSPVRYGAYSLKFTSAGASQSINYQFSSNTGPFFIRFYLNINKLPTITNTIFKFNGSLVGLKLTTTGTLQLFQAVGSQVGSDSAALNLNRWYRIEVKVDTTPASGSRVLHALIDGVEFAGTDTSTLSTTSGSVNFGTNMDSEADSGGEIFYVDDIAINDNTGSFQNSYPGPGAIIHIHPVGAGDSTLWTPDSGSNYARVNEVTPNDATSYVSSNTLNQEDLYTFATTLPLTSSINAIQVGVRYANNIADAVTAFKVELMKQSGGTKIQSSAIIPNSTTWACKQSVVPFRITSYQDPDNINWDRTTLDTIQAGIIISAGGTNSIRVSNIWLLVDYNPKEPLKLNNYQFITAGNGISVSEKIR